MSRNTLLDIAKANGSDAIVGLIDETIKNHPELNDITARTIKGREYKTLVRTALGRTTGSFRAANNGSDPVKSTHENRLVETSILEARFEIDAAVAESYEDGPEVYIALESSGILEGEMQGVASQFYYGAGNNSDGHPGLIQSYDATNMVIDAGGSTASTGSSVWFVREGLQDVAWVWGAGGNLALSPIRVETILGENGKGLDGYVRGLRGYPGLQVGSTRAVVRIKKLTADAGKGLTDDLISTALAKFPPGRGPNVVFMTQRSLAQLQASRTATTPTGAPAPFPTFIVGVDGTQIPIKVTEAISNTESLTL